MVSDGLKSTGNEMEVLDVAEIVWQTIKANDAKVQSLKESKEEE
jgi:hypothetical protein